MMQRTTEKPNVSSIGIRDIHVGKNVRIVQPVNLYDCFIDDDCFIGPFVEIQRGVHIGKNCRVQSHSFICEGVTIGNDCFVSHGAKFVNDVWKSGSRAYGNKSLWGKTRIGDNVLIGTNATILPVKITDDVVIGAGSVVTKDIGKSGKYAGNPARELKQ